MTEEQKQKLKIVYSKLSKDEKNLEYHIISLTDDLKDRFKAKETIKINIGGEVKNSSMMIGYTGVINVLQIR